MCLIDLFWCSRWSRIAQHLPGRTDNEIKNYWRTRVQKQARQLKIDVNSTRFRDTIRCLWIPRLLQKMESSSSPIPSQNPTQILLNSDPLRTSEQNTFTEYSYLDKSIAEDCSSSISSDSMNITQLTEISRFPSSPQSFGKIDYDPFLRGFCVDNSYDLQSLNPNSMSEITWVDGMEENLWNMDEMCGNLEGYKEGASKRFDLRWPHIWPQMSASNSQSIDKHFIESSFLWGDNWSWRL